MPLQAWYENVATGDIQPGTPSDDCDTDTDWLAATDSTSQLAAEATQNAAAGPRLLPRIDSCDIQFQESSQDQSAAIDSQSHSMQSGQQQDQIQADHEQGAGATAEQSSSWAGRGLFVRGSGTESEEEATDAGIASGIAQSWVL